MTAARVLALNAGSSSLKFGMFDVDDATCRAILTGQSERGGALVAHGFDGREIADVQATCDAEGTMAAIADMLVTQSIRAPDAIGHRIVHGGPSVRGHVRVDDAVVAQLHAAAAFAPLHVPPALTLLQAARSCYRDAPHVACLDTAFHRTMRDVARTLPIPAALRAQGIERYGFHGLSCASIVRKLGQELPARLVIAHLGHGASVTAVLDGQSIDTSMGLTPSGGVMMSTRTGDIDPGVLLYALRECGDDAAQLEALIDQRSGLLGVSGVSDDMRALRDAAVTNADARLAIDMFCYSVRKQISAMGAVLGGIDLLVFTGGIGEHDALARAAICTGLDAWGIQPGNGSHSRVRIMTTDENSEIARHARDIAFGTGGATVASAVPSATRRS
jgi:acetate kinase